MGGTCLASLLSRGRRRFDPWGRRGIFVGGRAWYKRRIKDGVERASFHGVLVVRDVRRLASRENAGAKLLTDKYA